jgi:hypothetical protein
MSAVEAARDGVAWWLLPYGVCSLVGLEGVGAAGVARLTAPHSLSSLVTQSSSLNLSNHKGS